MSFAPVGIQYDIGTDTGSAQKVPVHPDESGFTDWLQVFLATK
jgi:hypothetical protein